MDWSVQRYDLHFKYVVRRWHDSVTEKLDMLPQVWFIRWILDRKTIAIEKVGGGAKRIKCDNISLLSNHKSNNIN